MEKVDEQRIRLPHDVMIYILKRLPGKSAVRFKCISRTWYDLIYTTEFNYIHYNHDCPSNQFIIFKHYLRFDGNDRNSIYYNGKNMISFHSNDESFKSIAPNFEYNDNYIGVRIIGPCNGIVCITSYRSTVLYNPTLREVLELPPSNLPYRPQLSNGVELNCCTMMTTGIGFDPNTDDYKVIRILSPQEEYEWDDYDNLYKVISKVAVYNLSTNSWRKFEDLQCLVHPRYCPNVLINGAFHWRVTTLSPPGDCWIVSFNFSSELFQNILFPDGLDIKQSKSLVILKDSLALICYTYIDSLQDVVMEQPIEIWLMKKYSLRESWTKEFTVGPMAIETPLAIWMNDAELMIESNNGKVSSCNLLSGEIKELDLSGVPNTLEVVVCKESLISIKKERDKVVLRPLHACIQVTKTISFLGKGYY